MRTGILRIIVITSPNLCSFGHQWDYSKQLCNVSKLLPDYRTPYISVHFFRPSSYSACQGCVHAPEFRVYILCQVTPLVHVPFRILARVYMQAPSYPDPAVPSKMTWTLLFVEQPKLLRRETRMVISRTPATSYFIAISRVE